LAGAGHEAGGPVVASAGVVEHRLGALGWAGGACGVGSRGGEASYAVHKAVSKVLASHAAEGQSICVEVATPNHG